MRAPPGRTSPVWPRSRSGPRPVPAQALRRIRNRCSADPPTPRHPGHAPGGGLSTPLVFPLRSGASMSILDSRNSSFTPGAEPSGPPSLVREDPILITIGDMERLRAVVERHAGGVQDAAAEILEAELDRARVVLWDDLPQDVVTMHSRVLSEDVDTGERRELVLVYPEEADVQRSRISVLAPVGTALLGLSAGQSISWPVPGGRMRTIRVVSVVYQPEADGDRLLSGDTHAQP